jgi:hypothetical protein
MRQETLPGGEQRFARRVRLGLVQDIAAAALPPRGELPARPTPYRGLLRQSASYDASPMPPIWLDEDGQHAQTRPCPRPGCGRRYPIRRYRYETLRQIGWPLYRVARFTSWCGHGQEVDPGAG